MRLRQTQLFKMLMLIKFQIGFLTYKKGGGICPPSLLFFNRPNIDKGLFNKYKGQNLQGL